MSNEATTDDIHSASAPRSDQLNADSLIAGPIAVTIESVRKGNKEQPIIIELVGHPGTPWKPSKGMLRILIAGWSENPREWVGRRLRLFRNPAVKYAGVAVGGIEISHMSDIPHQLEATKTIAKGVKAPFIVKILEADEPPKPTHPTAEKVAEVKERWKASRNAVGEVVSPQLWKAFVFENVKRAFDVAKCAEWTQEDLTSVSDAIETEPAKEVTEDATEHTDGRD